MISRTFHADVKKFEDLTKKKLDEVMHRLATQGIDILQHNNPVYSGWSRASWLVSKNNPKDMVYSAMSGGFTAGHAYKGNRPSMATWVTPKQPGIGTITRFDKLVFSNAVPYGTYIEHKFGIMARAEYEFRVVIKQIVAAVKEGR